MRLHTDSQTQKFELYAIENLGDIFVSSKNFFFSDFFFFPQIFFPSLRCLESPSGEPFGLATGHVTSRDCGAYAGKSRANHCAAYLGGGGPARPQEKKAQTHDRYNGEPARSREAAERGPPENTRAPKKIAC